MYRPGVSTREGRAPARPEDFRQIRGRDALVASAPPSVATSATLPSRTPPNLGRHNKIRLDVTGIRATQFLKSSVPSCLRVLRVDRPEAWSRLPAPRADGGAGTSRAGPTGHAGTLRLGRA